ncbi:putative Long-chain-fatty-acyl-CoA reductase [Xenorhabdus nematophila ATCC 19061]|uniref:long-chain-fatty-acyl-CoA reductase n=1 Tax=Xenorhabdus nematophila (strain ATCC 19061 / DSM 3370 / CCUG 14189 / LMG 1036 / NCIMB 9965 / AN6) TaxID=406817 RepID=D3VFV7_XENNA|nr:acyl-CoA reductase [Xenorhabdus nematophila]CBJ92623.1 putative Long-chain-fatty-acyl-CoA reductase [Xenorhabdus nematophila ATCC 19061]CEK25430.1 putative Long-chain-fatty-acyl-CoA reductase [Xenorhabdus nematophila AN6/1]
MSSMNTVSVNKIDTRISAEQATEQKIANLRERLPELLAHPHSSEQVLACAQRFADYLSGLDKHPLFDAKAREALIAFCQRETLQTKLERELGQNAFSLRRFDYNENRYESWKPLGLVVHITPSNAELLPFMAVIESMLVGNINWLRPSSSDKGFSTQLLAEFLAHDISGDLADRVAVLPLPVTQLAELFVQADAVSAWGSDAALESIRAQLPSGCRWIDWGHRISFAWLNPDATDDAQLDALADDVCCYDQQACSSPQSLLVDSDDPDVLRSIGQRMAAALQRRSGLHPALKPDVQEAAEITTQTAFQDLDFAFTQVRGEIWRADGWRVIWRHEEELAASPLFRTLQIRPAPRQRLSSILLPWRNHLQSCALITHQEYIAEMSHALFAAGVSRITPPGQMHDGYSGEPHDGVYALSRLTKRVSVSLAPHLMANCAHLDIPPSRPHGLENLPVLNKTDFHALVPNEKSRLFFLSGGSSGEPKLAAYSYQDYHRQMQAAADGVFASGLEPATDKVMNLLYGGKLYGGMMSFFTILDKLDVAQYPMGGPADNDFSEIADFIVNQRVNTLVGMPSTLHRLFLNEETKLRQYGGIRKLFLGGEHVNKSQRAFLTSFGVNLIRSTIYGSVDAGPVGHACTASEDGVFHLMANTQWLEILNKDNDQPVADSETGRLIFTSLHREAQPIQRYDLGDLGYWINQPCSCGLSSPRFRLMGRHGSLLRVGSIFVNLADFSEQLGLPVQWIIDHNSDGIDCVRLLADHSDPTEVRQHLLQDAKFAEVVNGNLLNLDVVSTPATEFQRNTHCGKTPLFIDLRKY